MRLPLLLAAVLGACTSAERRPEPAVAAVPEPEADGPGPAFDPEGVAHWYWDIDERVVDAKSIPEGWRVVGDGPLRLQLLDKGVPRIDVSIPESDHHDTGVVVLHDGAVYVAHHNFIASGTTLARFAANDGQVVWSTPVEGLGPIDHSKYRNEVQLGLRDGHPVVYGNESSGAYTEMFDADRGHKTAHSRPPSVLLTLEWWFNRVEPKVLGNFVFREAQREGEPAKVSSIGADQPQWIVELPGNAFCGRAAMHELFGTLWVVRFCAIATGAELVGIDVKTGTVRVSRHLRALPDIGHSEYSAAVQLRDVSGYLVVMGNEAGGHYLEALHPETGATVVSRTWK